jgi:hypothetical protein
MPKNNDNNGEEKKVESRDLLKEPKGEKFYIEALKILNEVKIPYLLAGTFAVHAYTGIDRKTKDLDIFCTAGDYPKILAEFAQRGYKTEVRDERWLAKVQKGKYYMDVAFNSHLAITPVTERWFEKARETEVFGIKVKLLPPTQLIRSKVFVMDRTKYDGADVAHLILKTHKDIDWKLLLQYMDQYWEVLLMHVINFRFVYPSERELIPKWVLEELLERLQSQINTPTSKIKICRGRLLADAEYAIDIKEWGFEDYSGWATDQVFQYDEEHNKENKK